MPEDSRKTVMVSGCFDLLHSGNIAFFKEAARFGDLYVALGSDQTVYELKGRRRSTPKTSGCSWSRRSAT